MCERREEQVQIQDQTRTSEQQWVVSPIPETVDNFMQNFLLRLGLVRTLDCFQREWYKIQDQNQYQRVLIPDAWTHQILIQSELSRVRERAGLLRDQVLALNETLLRLQRERNFHQDGYDRAVRQKEVLSAELRRLQERHDGYAPAMRALTESYDAALRARTLVGLEAERVHKEMGRDGSDTSSCKDTRGQKNATTKHKDLSKKAAVNGQDRSLKQAKSEIHIRQKANRTISEMKLQELDLKTTGAVVEKEKGKNSKRENSQEEMTCHFTLSCSIKAHRQPISNVELHPTKRLLATSSDDRTWRLWALPTNQEKVGQLLLTGEGHSDWLTSCSFSPEGQRLATTSGDTTVRVWDFSGLCLLSLSAHLGVTWGSSFSSSGGCLASASSDCTLRLWDLASGRTRATLRRHSSAVSSVHFLPHSDSFLLSSSQDKTVILWDARTRAAGSMFRGHTSPCNYSAPNRAGSMLASCDSGGVVKLWDVRRPDVELLSWDTDGAGALQVNFGPVGTECALAVAGADGQVRLLQVSTGQKSTLGGSREHGGGGPVNSVRFDHQGETLLSAVGQGIVQVWSRSPQVDN